MFDFFWNISAFIIAIGILVTFHEYGHFWVARKCGVKVERFSIGFGKTLWRTFDKYGTEFVIAAIPLGGYVKMLDERVDDVSEQDKNKTFNSKNVYQRIAIIAAGPLANFLLAIVAFYFTFLIGTPAVKPVIGDVTPNSIAAQAKLPSQAQIVEVAGQSVLTWQDVNMALMGGIGHDTILIKTKTMDSQYQTKHVLNTQNWQFEPDKTTPMASLGFTPFMPKGTCEVAQVGKSSPAEQAGLLAGDVFVAVNGEPVSANCENFTDTIQQLPNQQAELLVLRDQVNIAVNVTLASKMINGEQRGYLGIGRVSSPWPDNYRFDLTYGLLDSVEQSLLKTWQVTRLSFDMITKLVTGDVSVKNLSGPIGIAQGAGNSANHGLVYFLGFIAFFSINLGIFNLLPLPVLDGGHLLYYLIELVTGRPVSDKYQALGFRIGAAALLSLMALAIFNDISRL